MTSIANAHYEILSASGSRHVVTWPDGASVTVEGAWKLAAEIAQGRHLVRECERQAKAALASAEEARKCADQAALKFKAASKAFEGILDWHRAP